MNQKLFNKTLLFKVTVIFMLLAFLNLSIACNYYKVRTFESLTSEMSKAELQKYQNLNRYLILHLGDKTIHITVDKLDSDKQILYCYADTVSTKHQLYDPESKNNQNYKRSESMVLNEVHIYASGIHENGKRIEIPLKFISRMDVIDKDTGRTVATHVFIALGITAGAIGVLYLLILLLKSSCPFVYVQNGTAYQFKGEIYGGAIFKPLQRNDYLHLSTLNSNDTVFKIRISNELKEIQYTDLANIILAEHDNLVQTVIDNKGNIHSIQQPQLPETAILNGVKNVKQELLKIDSSYCLFDVENKAHYINELQLQFNKPENAQQAKLIIHAKNSLFLDFAFTEFTKLFGRYYDTFIEKQNHANRDSLLNWSVNQGLPLSVYVKKNNEWKLVEQITTVGPLAARDICVPIEVGDLNDNQLEIKLSCGYNFWEVDYAAVDFSKDVDVHSVTLKPTSAIEENGNDVTAALANADSNYLIQPKPGNMVDITYQLPKLKKDKSYDAFLMSNGYYQHVRDYTGIPDKDYLKSFKQKGAFIDFAKSLQDKLLQNTGLANAH